MKTIAVIGSEGYVGKQVCSFFEDHYEVIRHDKALFGGSRVSKQAVIKANADFAFVCVPTPSKVDGSCDTSLVEETLEWLDGVDMIIVKSTVPPGFCQEADDGMDRSDVVFCPEFVGESSYCTRFPHSNDMKKSPYFIFGGYPKKTSRCVDLYAKVAGPMAHYIQTSHTVAEMVKYMTNCLFAAKVGLAEEFYDLCLELGIDYNAVREIWSLNPMVNPMHTQVFPDDRGFGGKCLPKDLDALIALGNKRDCPMKILQVIASLNYERRGG